MGSNPRGDRTTPSAASPGDSSPLHRAKRGRGGPTIGRLEIVVAACTLELVLVLVTAPGGLVLLFQLSLMVLWLGAGNLGWRAARRRPRYVRPAFVAALAMAFPVVLWARVYWQNGAVEVLVPLPWGLADPPVVGVAPGLWRLSAGPRPGFRVPALMAALVASCAVSDWPMRAAFWASRPALERLADRVEVAGKLDRPEWAGVYRVAADRHSGTDALLLLIHYRPADQDGFPAGFVREKGPRGRPDLARPWHGGLWSTTGLGGDWTCRSRTPYRWSRVAWPSFRLPWEVRSP